MFKQWKLVLKIDEWRNVNLYFWSTTWLFCVCSKLVWGGNFSSSDFTFSIPLPPPPRRTSSYLKKFTYFKCPKSLHTVKFTFSFLSNFLEYLAFVNVIILTPISHSLTTRKSYLALLEYYCHCQVDHVNHVKSITKTMMITTTTTMMRWWG